MPSIVSRKIYSSRFTRLIIRESNTVPQHLFLDDFHKLINDVVMNNSAYALLSMAKTYASIPFSKKRYEMGMRLRVPGGVKDFVSAHYHIAGKGGPFKRTGTLFRSIDIDAQASSNFNYTITIGSTDELEKVRTLELGSSKYIEGRYPAITAAMDTYLSGFSVGGTKVTGGINSLISEFFGALVFPVTTFLKQLRIV